jgi:hypothetical protein
LIARRTKTASAAALGSLAAVPRRSRGASYSGQRLALLLLLCGASATAGCYLTLDTDALEAKAAGSPSDAGTEGSEGNDGGSGKHFTTSLDTPPIELDLDGVDTTRDPCVATTQQARQILTTHCSECHAPPGAAAGFSSILDFPTLITLRSATAKDPVTGEFVRLVVPGQPEKSRVYLRARNGEMPPTRPPSERQLPRPTTSSISVLHTWIRSCLGSDNSGSEPPAGTQ